jgi:hypothetical protein
MFQVYFSWTSTVAITHQWLASTAGKYCTVCSFTAQLNSRQKVAFKPTNLEHVDEVLGNL